MGELQSGPTDELIRERTPRGWLRPYLLALDELFLKRWDYWIRTVDTGEVLDEPIPRIEWSGTGHPEPRKNLETCINFCRDQFSRQAFALFVEWLLFGFGDAGVKAIPPQVGDRANAFWYQTFNLGLFLQYPHDYLGEYAADLYGNSRHNSTAYFPTPMSISAFMAKMLLSEKDKTASICDPCVGSGRLLMAASNYALNLYGVDIDYNILNVCKANMWMYVPWAVSRPLIRGLEPAVPAQCQDAPAIQPIQQTTPEVQKKLLTFGGQMNLFAGTEKR